MTKKFLLSTGQVTTKTEEYILDLFKLYLGVDPGDVPYLPDFGFNFTFAGIPKSELYDKMQYRIESFVSRIQESFPGHTVSLEDIRLVDEGTVSIVVSVDNSLMSDLFINIYENS